jgi:hypothetical protein
MYGLVEKQMHGPLSMHTETHSTHEMDGPTITDTETKGENDVERGSVGLFLTYIHAATPTK